MRGPLDSCLINFRYLSCIALCVCHCTYDQINGYFVFNNGQTSCGLLGITNNYVKCLGYFLNFNKCLPTLAVFLTNLPYQVIIGNVSTQFADSCCNSLPKSDSSAQMEVFQLYLRSECQGQD